MTEPDWLSADSPHRLFQHVKARLSARKLKLLACGCCRLLDAHLSDGQRNTLTVVERHADGLAADDDYQRVQDQFLRQLTALSVATPSGATVPPSVEGAVAEALVCVVGLPNDSGLRRALECIEAAAGRAGGPGGARAARREIARRMCEVFREIVGNPFSSRMAVGPEWVAAGGRAAAGMLRVSGTARGIAVGVEANQAYDRLAILADALQDDGCADADLLAHLRGGSHHLRGCWALDLVLGKS